MMDFFNKLIGAVFALATIGIVGSAAAATFEFNATCAAGCANFGLIDLDPVSGQMSFSNASIVPNAAVDTADVVGFSFPIGTFAIDDTTAVDFAFSGTLDGTATSFSSFGFTATEAPSGVDDTITLLLNFPGFSDQGRAGLGRCVGPCTPPGGSFAGGGIRISSDLTLRVPEPTTLTVFGLGLAGLGFARRRKQKAA